MSNHITTEYDENSLTAAQLAGRACVVCGNESGPMVPVSLYIHEGGETDWVACSDDEPASDTAIALKAMRDALGVDVVTGLDLADAVKVGMVLGQLLASDGDTRLPADDLTDTEHDTLKHAVQDLLNRRRGVDPDHERALLAFRWGSLSAWSLAMELDMSAQDIAHAAGSSVERGGFTESERDRLLALLEDIVNERMGLTAPGWQPIVVPFDSEGRCSDASCVSCHSETVQASA